jgi:hypothetical protein
LHYFDCNDLEMVIVGDVSKSCQGHPKRYLYIFSLKHSLNSIFNKALGYFRKTLSRQVPPVSNSAAYIIYTSLGGCVSQATREGYV